MKVPKKGFHVYFLLKLYSSSRFSSRAIDACDHEPLVYSFIADPNAVPVRVKQNIYILSNNHPVYKIIF